MQLAAEQALNQQEGPGELAAIGIIQQAHQAVDIKEVTLGQVTVGEEEGEVFTEEEVDQIRLVQPWEEAEDLVTSEAVTAPVASPPQDPQP